MPKLSAGVLVHRRTDDGNIEVLLVHPGGPYWATKDEHAWSIPKGEYEPDDDPFETAQREFTEELGQPAPDGDYELLGQVDQSKAKRVIAWSVEADLEVTAILSNEFEMEWPPRSGQVQSFPEVDRADWFTVDAARIALVLGQLPLLDLLLERLAP